MKKKIKKIKNNLRVSNYSGYRVCYNGSIKIERYKTSQTENKGCDQNRYCRKGKKGNIMKTNRSARFVIDFVKKTITGSEASFKKAGKGKGLEYDELTEKIAKHPDFELVVIAAKKSTKAKRTYDGLNYKFMEEYFLTQTTAVELTKEYNNVRKMAKETGRKEFPFTKKWFLDKFSTEDNPFDMEEAKAKIEEVLYAEAAARCTESIKAVATENQQEAEPAKVA